MIYRALSVKLPVLRLIIAGLLVLKLSACGMDVDVDDDFTDDFTGDFTDQMTSQKNLSPKDLFLTSVNPRVIYGEDDRLDLYEVEDLKVLKLAQATALLVGRFGLEDQGNGSTLLKTDTFGRSHGLCQTERFFHQPTLGFCSGFLVGPDTLMTAGHCMRRASDCSLTRFVFGYGYYEKDDDLSLLPTSQIYSCREIIKTVVEPRNADYAIIRLDRPVEGVTPLRVRTQGQIQVGEPLFVIGNPTGLPTKVAGGAQVREHKDSHFVANLDTYVGNSGSAVFNASTLEVEGILVRGETDFRYDGYCRVSYQCPDDGCRGEDVTNITVAR